MIEAGTFIDRFGVSSGGAPMWLKKIVVSWTAKNPPEPVTMTFDGANENDWTLPVGCRRTVLKEP